MGGFRARLLGEIKIEDNVIGEFVGINTRDIDFKNDKNLDKYMNSILSLKGNCNLIYMEDYNLTLYKYIESSLNLNYPKGRNIRLYNIGMILNETLTSKKDKWRQEVLILCEEVDLAYEIIRLISYNFKFINLIGIARDKSEKLRDRIFEDMGISIFQTENIKSISEYTGIIINFNEKLNGDLIDELNRLNKDTIIIDFSMDKPLLVLKDFNIIIDISFNTSEDIILENPLISREIPSILYETLFENRIEKFDEILKSQKNIEKYNKLDQGKLKGRL